VTGRLGEHSHGTWPLSTASSSSFRKDRSATRTRADVRVVLAGLSARLAAELRADECEVERTLSQSETMRSMRRCPAPRLLVVSEMLPGAGDVVAAVEADGRLASLVVVAMVGGRTALASALRRGGLPVVRRRGAARRLKRLLRCAETAFHRTSEQLMDLSRARTASSQRQVRRSKRLIEESHRLCARFRGCGSRRRSVHSNEGMNAEP